MKNVTKGNVLSIQNFSISSLKINVENGAKTLFFRRFQGSKESIKVEEMINPQSQMELLQKLTFNLQFEMCY